MIVMVLTMEIVDKEIIRTIVTTIIKGEMPSELIISFRIIFSSPRAPTEPSERVKVYKL